MNFCNDRIDPRRGVETPVGSRAGHSLAGERPVNNLAEPHPIFATLVIAMEVRQATCPLTVSEVLAHCDEIVVERGRLFPANAMNLVDDRIVTRHIVTS